MQRFVIVAIAVLLKKINRKCELRWRKYYAIGYTSRNIYRNILRSLRVSRRSGSGRYQYPER